MKTWRHLIKQKWIKMNRCITKQLAFLKSQHLLTPAQQRIPANAVLSRTLYSSAGLRTLLRPNVTFSTHLRSLSTRLTTSAARRLRPTSITGDRLRILWSTLRRGRLSDRSVERCGLVLAVSWFTLLTVQSECDRVDFDLLVKNKILDPDEEQTGWDRLVAMYTLDEMGGLTPELELVRNIATAGLLIGGSLGGMMNARLAIAKFVERNQATPFESQIVAKRALQDRVTLGMARGFFMFGWRTALFTSAFTLVSTTLMVYTNQISALHYSCGGMVAGALYKANLGLRGMTAGAVAGGLLGLMGGGIFSLTCYLTDTTLPKLRYQQYLWKYQQDLRDKARAERKREKKRLEAEKKLEAKKDELAQTELQNSVTMAVHASAGSQETSAEQNPGNSHESRTDLGTVSSEEAVSAHGLGSSGDAAAAPGISSSEVVTAGVQDTTEARFDFDAAVATAAAVVSGSEVRTADGGKGAVETVKAS